VEGPGDDPLETVRGCGEGVSAEGPAKVEQADPQHDALLRLPPGEAESVIA
jgi:hypothetical protein